MYSMKPEWVKENVPLAPYTTFRVGGPARYFSEIISLEMLREALAWANETGVRVVTLGGGSNVVLPDEGLDVLVLAMRNQGVKVLSETEATVIVEVAAGEVWDEWVAESVKNGWWGIENLSSIPGTVGASPIQNIGAYGVEVGSLISKVKAIEISTEEQKDFTNEQCQFGYRDSFFKTDAGKDCIVTSVEFELSKLPKPNLQYKDLKNIFAETAEPNLTDIRQAVIDIRAGKFPDLNDYGTAGSFFKNPVVGPEILTALQSRFPDLVGHETVGGIKLSAAWLIDKVAGLRGHYEGAVGCFDKQSLVMVNRGGASAIDIDEFANFVVARVKEKTGITLEREVQFIK